MRVLVGCEESQAVVHAMLEAGHDAYSCDLQPCSGNYPERHFQREVFDVLENEGPWDLFIAHPVCTYLCNSGVSHLHLDTQRWVRLFEAADFFVKLWDKALDVGVPRIAFENPIPHKYAVRLIGRKYDQLVQPWMFGHPESKATCFWLHNLEPLRETNNVKAEYQALPKSQAQRIHYLSPGPERAKERSKTFPGIAQAMTQWASGVETQLFPSNMEVKV